MRVHLAFMPAALMLVRYLWPAPRASL